jgi:carbon starvation protein CstA
MLIIFSALVSLLAQILKNVTRTSEWVTLLIVLVLSLVAAYVDFLLTQFNLMESFIAIMTIAGAIYTFIIQRFETDAPNGTNGILNVNVPASASAPG